MDIKMLNNFRIKKNQLHIIRILQGIIEYQIVKKLANISDYRIIEYSIWKPRLLLI